MNNVKHLWGRWYIGSDKLNFILYERVINTKGIREGKERYVPYGYHTTIKSLKYALINLYTIDNIHNIDTEEFFSKLTRIINIIEEETRK